MSVLVAERGGVGAGASGGPVGALTPHVPVNWTPLKAFQCDALLSLEEEVHALEAETGHVTGYARVGRLTPVTSAKARARVPEQVSGAALRWAGADLSLLDAPPPGTLAREACPHGVIRDTLSARIRPAAYLAALACGTQILEGWTLCDLLPDRAIFDRGSVAADRIVLTAGWDSFRLLGLAGDGVKGQAAVLGADLPEDLPVIQGRGLFVCAHGAGRVAVGSTSETDWTHTGPDDRLDGVIAAARALVPALRPAPVLARWAGIRPRAADRLPLVGPVPGRPGVIVATGGYKIGVALAQAVGRGVAAMIRDEAHGLPPEFDPRARQPAVDASSEQNMS